MSDPLLLTIDELCGLLKVSPGTVYYWVSRNEIPYVKVGRHLRFVLDEVLRHFRKMTEEKKPACFKPGFLLEVGNAKHCSLKNEASAESVNRKKGYRHGN